MGVDRTPRVIGLVAEHLRRWFDPGQERPPLGGGTSTVHVLAGEMVVPPPWLVSDGDQDSSRSDCGPYLWVRLVRRWRTTASGATGSGAAVFPDEQASAGCGAARAITVEAGIARCHPLDGDPIELERHAAIQWDDSWRIDSALCAALRQAETVGAASDTAIGGAEPFGPEGMVIAWLQQAYARL